jgi:hypothetical protein
MGIEDPDADVAEQQRSTDDGDDAADEAGVDLDELPPEADAADVADQRRIVPQDVDEP